MPGKVNVMIPFLSMDPLDADCVAKKEGKQKTVSLDKNSIDP